MKTKNLHRKLVVWFSRFFDRAAEATHNSSAARLSAAGLGVQRHGESGSAGWGENGAR